MGNKSSHDEMSDREESHGKLRDMFKHKSLNRPSSVFSPKSGSSGKDEHDAHLSSRRDSNQPDVTSSETDLHSSSILSSSPGFKPDGIVKLAKELINLSHDEENCEGIALNTFSKYLCHGNQHLGRALFQDCLKSGKSSKKSSSGSGSVLSKEQFVAWSRKVTQLMGDEPLLTYYIQIFMNEEDMLTMESVSHFMQSCYHLSMGNVNPTEYDEETVQMVLLAMFHGKNILGSKYVVHWIEQNCPRVVIWMHRNLLHQLTVGFRQLQKKKEAKAETELDGEFPTNLETPVLDVSQRDFLSFQPGSPLASMSPLQRTFSFVKQISESHSEAEQLLSQTRLHPMQIWLLGCTLPQVFTRPLHLQKLQHSQSTNGIILMDPHTFITRMVASQNPTHWTPLYNSDNDGLSLNRFEHHIMGYRGPTVTFVYAEGNRIFCLAVDQAWKESIHFWGSPNTIVLQLSPEYRVLDRGEKMMYYNTSARGYPFGLHIGRDHRDPQVAIDKEFSSLSYRKIPYRLDGVQVWGCGTMEHRELQLDHKKWEMKQVEKSRQVKLSAGDWNDHPDKCLLDMAGHRPNYSQFGNS